MSDDSNFDCENNINEAARVCCDNLHLLCRGKGMKKFSGNLKHGVTGKK
jgi:hypothetical protein